MSVVFTERHISVVYTHHWQTGNSLMDYIFLTPDYQWPFLVRVHSQKVNHLRRYVIQSHAILQGRYQCYCILIDSGISPKRFPYAVQSLDPLGSISCSIFRHLETIVTAYTMQPALKTLNPIRRIGSYVSEAMLWPLWPGSGHGLSGNQWPM